MPCRGSDMRQLNLINRGERALLRAAFSSIATRYRAKWSRLIHRRAESSDQPAAHSPDPIFLTTPSVGDREFAQLVDSMTFGWAREPVRQFESRFAQYLGVPHALATSSCTGALHLALRAFGIGAGDEVLVPESTCIATASAVLLCGATPVFVDVDPMTWGISPPSARAAITDRTRAMIPVHVYGRVGDMPELLALAKEKGLKVIEDAAAATGTICDGKRAGTFGDAAVFSFHSTKLMTSAEGGMLVTADPVLFNRAFSLAHHGVKSDLQTAPTEVGMNYKMSHLHAAIGLAQLGRIDELLERKRRLFGWYETRLRSFKGLRLDPDLARARSNLWMVVVMLEDDLAGRRDAVVQSLQLEKIYSAPFAVPLSSLPMFKSREAANPVAFDLWRRGILLPCGFDLAESHVDRVCLSLRNALELPPVA